MALRRFRHSYQSPLPGSESSKASVPAVAAGFSSSRAVSNDTAVELHIRCPGNQNLKASFTAGACPSSAFELFKVSLCVLYIVSPLCVMWE